MLKNSEKYLVNQNVICIFVQIHYYWWHGWVLHNLKWWMMMIWNFYMVQKKIDIAYQPLWNTRHTPNIKNCVCKKGKLHEIRFFEDNFWFLVRNRLDLVILFWCEISRKTGFFILLNLLSICQLLLPIYGKKNFCEKWITLNDDLITIFVKYLFRCWKIMSTTPIYR